MKGLKLFILIFFSLIILVACRDLEVPSDINSGPNRDDSQMSLFNVQYLNYDHSLIANFKVLSGQPIPLPDNPTREGYLFNGWKDDIPNNMPSNDLTFISIWTVKNYYIEFRDYDNELINRISLSYGEKIIESLIPQIKNDTFVGWNSAIPEFMPAFDLVLFADYDSVNHFIHFNTSGGDNLDSIEVMFSRSLDKLPVPKREGYEFLGWINNSYTNMPPYNLTLEAEWKLIQYPIQYNLDGGDNNPNNPEFIDIKTETFLFLAPTKTGHNFIGWFDNPNFEGNEIKFYIKGIPLNYDLYAKWEPLNIDVNYYAYDYNADLRKNISLHLNESVTDIFSGGIMTAVVTDMNRIFVWENNNNRLPVELTNYFNLTQDDKIIDISLGGFHNALLTSNGRVFTWGRNDYGQLGTRDNRSSEIPIDITNNFPLSDSAKIIKISLGVFHSSAVDSNGFVYLWGSNCCGEIARSPFPVNRDQSVNTPRSVTRDLELDINETIVDISLGEKHTGVLTSEGRVLLFGFNQEGMLGNGENTQVQYTPVDITSGFNLNSDDKIVSISLNGWHSSALSLKGELFTWGDNSTGQLGNKSLRSDNKPNNITKNFDLKPYENISDITMMRYGGLALTSKGRIFTWGSNQSGQLGTGQSSEISRQPVEVDFLYQDNNIIVKKITSGWTTNSILTNDNKFFYWGTNTSATGPNSIFNTPTQLIFNELQLIDSREFIFGAEIDSTIQKDGFYNDEWFLDASFNRSLEKLSKARENIALFGIWKVLNLSINYNLNGGENNPNNPQAYNINDSVIDLNQPTKTGYTFVGWYENDDFEGSIVSQVIPEQLVEINLFARWLINDYNIQFVINDDLVFDTLTLKFNEKISLPNNVSKVGFRFEGWYFDQEFKIPFDLDLMPSNDLKIYARLEPLLIVVEFVLNSDQDDFTDVSYAGSGLFEPIFENHIFMGWYTDSDLTVKYDFDTFPTSNMTLYAKWNQINE